MMRQALVEVSESIGIAWCQLTVKFVPSRREAYESGRLAGYSIGYRHGKRDSGVLKLVVDNEAAPVNLYPARHAASG
jgi:hypothetical protein